MFRIEAVRVCALFFGAVGSVAVAAPLAGAQDFAGGAEEREGPAPIDSTQSISAGADDDIGDRGRRRSRADDAETQAAGAPGRASGSYAGVVPGAANKAPPAAKAARATNGPTITWPGFQMRPDGSSRVFIQSTAPLEPKVLSSVGTKFELQLPRARVAAKTNRLPLDTRFFNTPVTKVSVSSASGGAVVQIELRATVTPTVTSETGPTGYFFTYIELPKGDYLARPGAVATTTSSSAIDAAPPMPASKVIGKASTSATSTESSGSARGEASISAGIKIGR